MERLQSPTSELSRDLCALRLGHSTRAEETDVIAGQQASRESHDCCAFQVGTTALCTPSANEHTSQLVRREGMASHDPNFHLQAYESTTNVEHSSNVSTTTCVNDCQDTRTTNRVALVFSHVEPTQDEASSVQKCTCTCSQDCRIGRGLRDEICLVHKQSTTDPSTTATAMADPESVQEMTCETESLANHLKALSVSVSNLRSDLSQDSTNVTNNGATNVSSHDHLLPYQAHLLGSHHGNGGCGSCREEALYVGGHMDDVTVDELAGYFDQLLYLPRPMSEMAQLMYT